MGIQTTLCIFEPQIKDKVSPRIEAPWVSKPQCKSGLKNQTVFCNLIAECCLFTLWSLIMSYGTNAPFGLQPRLHKNGSIWNGQLTSYPLASGYNQSIFTGDPVYIANIDPIASGTRQSSIVVAGQGNGNTIAGVFMGVKYYSAAGAGLGQGTATFVPSWSAGTRTLNDLPAEALICDDPTVIYDIQADQTLATGVGLNDLFQNAAVIIPAGDALSGQSRATLGTLTPQADGQLKILSFTQNPKNKPGTQFNNVLVSLNNNLYNGGHGTPGITPAAGSIETATVPLAAANITAMNGAPVQILAAPGAGKAYVVNSVSITQQTIATAAFTGGGNVGFQYGSSAALAGTAASSQLPAAIFLSNSYGPFNFAGVVPGNLALVANEPITISNLTAAFATGTASSYTVLITYTTVTL